MNTINDLRDTLAGHAHAADLADTAHGARSASITRRVHAVRRRRAAGVGIASVAAVVAATVG